VKRITLVLLAGCGGSSPPPQAPLPPETTEVASVAAIERAGE